MPVNSALEQVFGTMGTVCWTGQIIPQIWKSWRAKKTEGLSPWLMLIWGVACVFLGVFVILQKLNIPLIIQPQLFEFFSLIAWSQCLYYDQRKPLKLIVIVLPLILLTFGGLEAGMIFAARPAVNRGNEKPVTFFGVMTAILLAAGLLPQYWEIFRFGEVKGISMLFITIDTLGGVFSFLSLVFRKKFDVLAGVSYGLVVVLDSIVILLAIILNPRAERRRRRLAEQNADQETQTATTIDTPISLGPSVQPSISASRRASITRSYEKSQTEKD